MSAPKYDKEIINYFKMIGFPLLYILPNQYEDLCLEAVKQKHYACEAMKLIKKQTDEICLIAVKQDGRALQYVKNQTVDICIAAVKQNGLALKFVNNQNYEICVEAVKQNGMALQFVKQDISNIYFSKYNNIKIVTNKENCNICLSTNMDEWCEITNCNHHFHKECLFEWIKEKNTCPNCRNILI